MAAPARAGGAGSRALDGFTVLGGGVSEVNAVFRNEQMIPTRSQRSADRKIGVPDRATISVESGDVQVVSVGMLDPWSDRVGTPELRRPADFRLWQGIDGDGAVRIRWIVRGTGKIKITYAAQKGGTASSSVDLR